MSNLPWFIGIMLVLWLAWFYSGGPEGGRTDRPFLEPPPPLSSGETYGPSGLVPTYTGGLIQQRTPSPSPTPIPAEEEIDVKDISLFGGKVSLAYTSRTGVTASDPQMEYLVLAASGNNTEPVQITHWSIKSAITGKTATIGQGAYLPYAGRVNAGERIFLRPGEEAVIATGRSPIGTSFKLNTCTGYFEQFQDFTPFLPRECPLQRDEDAPVGVTDACLDFLETIPRCETYVKALPLSLSGDPLCQEHISGSVHYNGCVELHKDDSNFYKPYWRIYLGRDQELWKEKRETILLLDENGKRVDSLSY